MSKSKIIGLGKIMLQMSSRIELMLVDVLHVLNIRKNLILGLLLVKRDIVLVFEADKVILTKNKDFVGNGYLEKGLFKLNTTLSKYNLSN